MNGSPLSPIRCALKVRSIASPATPTTSSSTASPTDAASSPTLALDSGRQADQPCAVTRAPGGNGSEKPGSIGAESRQLAASSCLVPHMVLQEVRGDERFDGSWAAAETTLERWHWWDAVKAAVLCPFKLVFGVPAYFAHPHRRIACRHANDTQAPLQWLAACRTGLSS